MSQIMRQTRSQQIRERDAVVTAAGACCAPVILIGDDRLSLFGVPRGPAKKHQPIRRIPAP